MHMFGYDNEKMMGGGTLQVSRNEDHSLEQRQYDQMAAFAQSRHEFKKIAQPTLCFSDNSEGGSSGSSDRQKNWERESKFKRQLDSEYEDELIQFRFCISQSDRSIRDAFPNQLLETVDCIDAGMQFRSPKTCLLPPPKDSSEDPHGQGGGFRKSPCIHGNDLVEEICVEVQAELSLSSFLPGLRNDNPNDEDVYERRFCFPEENGRKFFFKSLEEMQLAGIQDPASTATEMVCLKQKLPRYELISCRFFSYVTS